MLLMKSKRIHDCQQNQCYSSNNTTSHRQHRAPLLPLRIIRNPIHPPIIPCEMHRGNRKNEADARDAAPDKEKRFELEGSDVGYEARIVSGYPSAAKMIEVS